MSAARPASYEDLFDEAESAKGNVQSNGDKSVVVIALYSNRSQINCSGCRTDCVAVEELLKKQPAIKFLFMSKNAT